MTSIECRSCQFTSSLLWWACVSVWIDVTVSGLKVKFGVLLPENAPDRTMHPCTILSLAKAEERLIAEDLAALNWIVDSPTSAKPSTPRNWSVAISIQFDYSNSQCSDMYGPIRAVEIYNRGAGTCRAENSGSRTVKSPDIRVFYGPCCKFTLAAVGKYAKVWDVPLITPGGLTYRFNHVDYSELTRFTAPYEKVAEFLLSLLARYNWWHFSLLYHNNIGPDSAKGHGMCYDIREAVIKLIPRFRRASQSTEEDDAELTTGEHQDNCCVVHQENFNENYYDSDEIGVMLDEIKNASRGEYLTRTLAKVRICENWEI